MSKPYSEIALKAIFCNVGFSFSSVFSSTWERSPTIHYWYINLYFGKYTFYHNSSDIFSDTNLWQHLLWVTRSPQLINRWIRNLDVTPRLHATEDGIFQRYTDYYGVRYYERDGALFCCDDDAPYFDQDEEDDHDEDYYDRDNYYLHADY